MSRSLFIGRWQPFHDGHKKLIDVVLKEGGKVLIAVRDTPVFEQSALEYIDLVDGNNVVVGITDAKTAHEKKQLHRVVGILLFDKAGNIILQSETKYNLLELSVGGHVKRGESYEDAAHREMFEELGIKTPIDHLFTFLPVNNKMGHFWSIFKGEIPVDWEFKQTAEVKSIIRVNFQEFLK